MNRRRRITAVAPSVVAPDAPTLTAPADESDVYDGVAVTVSATVTAGQVPDRIDFVLDPGPGEVVVATDSSSPYSQSWTPTGVTPGAHTLVARFVYGSGSVDSAAIDIVLFNPGVLTGNALWLEGDDVTEAAGVVSSWNDQSGNARHFTSVGGGEPTYEATGGPNSAPSISFPASKDLRRGSNPFGALTAADFFIVHKFDNADTAGTTNCPWYFCSAVTNDIWKYNIGPSLYCGVGSTTRQVCGNPTQAMTSWHVARVTSTATEFTVKVGTQDLYTTGTNTVGWPATCVIGSSLVGSGVSMVGDIAFVAIYDNKLSAPSYARLQAYLAAKFGAIAGT